MILVKENTSFTLKIILETCFAYSLPFLFSFFFFANNCNTYWHLSLFLSGFIYGIITGQLLNIIITFPLSCLLSFIFYFAFINNTTSISFFYHSLPVIIISMISAFLGYIYKIWLTFFISNYLHLIHENRSAMESHKIFKAQQERLLLENKIYNSIRLKTLDSLSKGFAGDLIDNLTVILGQITLLSRRAKKRTIKDTAIKSLEISIDAVNLINQLLQYDSDNMIDKITILHEMHSDTCPPFKPLDTITSASLINESIFPDSILLIESNNDVENTIHEMCSLIGYHNIICYPDMESALLFLENDNKKIDLFIIDTHGEKQMIDLIIDFFNKSEIKYPLLLIDPYTVHKTHLCKKLNTTIELIHKPFTDSELKSALSVLASF